MKRIIFLMFFYVLFTNAQEKRVHYFDDLKLINVQNKELEFIFQPLDSLLNAGFYTLKKDSISEKENNIYIYFRKGNNFQKSKLVLDKDSYNVLKDSIIYTSNVDSILNLVKNHYLEKGFPFVRIKSENKSANEIAVSTILNEKRFINKFVYSEGSKLPKSYKKQLNKFYLNQDFTKKNIELINNELLSNEFIDQFKNPQVLYTKDSTNVYIYTKNRKNSNFDGVLGFNSDNQNKVRLSGNVTLNLVNLFNSFEKIALAWRSTALESTELKINVNIPYLFRNYIGSESSIQFFKQDSTYANIQLIQKIKHQISQNQSIGLSTIYEQSNYVIKENPNLEFQDYQKSGIGLHYSYLKRRASRLLPFSTVVNLEALSLTNKREISENLTQYQLEGRFERLQQIYNKHYLYYKLNAFALFSDEFQQNELRRIGGFQTVRGFNEDLFFVDSYLINSLEYRYLSSESIYLSVFSDYAWIQNKLQNQNDQLMSFGIGFGVNTKFGIFSLNYAIGKTSETNFDFQQSKIHLGVISFF